MLQRRRWGAASLIGQGGAHAGRTDAPPEGETSAHRRSPPAFSAPWARSSRALAILSRRYRSPHREGYDGHGVPRPPDHCPPGDNRSGRWQAARPLHTPWTINSRNAVGSPSRRTPSAVAPCRARVSLGISRPLTARVPGCNGVIAGGGDTPSFPRRYAGKLGTGAGRGRSGGVPASGVDDTVGEAFADEYLRDELVSVELAPVPLGVLDELEDHRQAGVAAARALRAAMA